MRHRREFCQRALLGALISVLPVLAGAPAMAAGAPGGNLNATLARLNAASQRFRSTTADFEFDSVQTQPVPDTDVQKGVVYYKRNGSDFQMGVHIDEVNGQPAPKVIVCCQGGDIKLYSKLENHVTVLDKLSQYESWFMLGFGASGADLADKWNITDEGPESVDGVQTEKLEMVPKDPAVRKNVPKVTLWMDLNRGISLKQRFDEGPYQYRICHYFNIRMNQSQPKDAYMLPTNKKTTTSTQ